MRGYMILKTDPAGAREYFRRVVELTPPSDENHQKAASRLRELSPP